MLGEVGAGAGVGVVVLPEAPVLGVDMLPLALPLVLPLVPPVEPAAPVRASARHLSRSAPIGMAWHLASAALLVELEPVVALGVLGVVAEPEALPPVVAAGDDGEVVELDDCAMASEDRPRSAAAVAAVRVFSIMGRVSSRKLATV